MHEKTVEEIISRYPAEVWPGCDLRLVARQTPLDSGRLDLHMRDQSGDDWILELKRGPFPPSGLLQLAQYVQELRQRSAGRLVHGMAVGTSFSPESERAARHYGLAIRTFDEAALRAIARAHGLPLDRASLARPNTLRGQDQESKPRGPGSRRGATDPARAAALAALDARFPPASLRGDTPEATLREYWAAASPSAGRRWQHVAASLTREVLVLAPDAAVGNRAAGGWSTVLAANGDVLAAIDARSTWVKFDFLLPEDEAQRCEQRGLVRLHHPRRYGRWCMSRVGPVLSEARARELLRIGIEFEYSRA